MALRRMVQSRSLLPWLGLALPIILTLVAWQVLSHQVQHRSQERFEAEALVVRDRIATRIMAHEQLLLAAAQFGGHDPSLPTREQWRHYVTSLELERLNPGVQAIGLAEWIPASQHQRHVARLRAGGFPDYEVQPGGSLPPEGGVSSIIYLEPFDARNRRAFAHDMLADGTRRAAMFQARDNGRAVISGKVILYQEDSDTPQAGTVLFAPVYRAGRPLESVSQRQEALVGWVYLAFRMENLMAGILGDSSPGLDLSLFDGERERPEELLFQRRSPAEPPNHAPEARSRFHVAGRSWTLLATPNSKFMVLWEGSHPAYILLVGLFSSVGLFVLIRSLAGAERQALQLADERLEKLETLIESAAEGIYGLDAEGNGTFFNPAGLRMLGYRHEDELLGKNIHQHIHHTQSDGSPFPVQECPLYQAFHSGVEVHLAEEIFWRADGTSFPVECWSYPLRRRGELVGAVVTFMDITARKQAERDLGLSAERLALATRAGGVGVWDYDVLNNRLEWDEQMFHLYGVDPASFDGVYEAWRAGLHPQDLDRAEAEIQRAILGEKDFDTEFRVVRPDGFTRDIRALALVQRDASGRALRMIGTNWDITEQKRAELEHLQMEQRLALAMDATGDGIWDWDIPSGQVKHNARWCQILGFDEAYLEHPLDTFTAQIHAEDQPRVMAAIQACLEGRAPYHSQHRMLTAEGGIAWVLDRGQVVAWDAGGQPTRLVGSMADITEQKQAEASLRESELRFRRLFELLPVGVTLTDHSGHIIQTNATSEGMLGIPVDEALRRELKGTYWQIIRPDGSPMPADEFPGVRALAEQHRVEDVEMGVRRGDGSVSWLNVCAEPVSEGGMGVLIVYSDVTANREMMQALRELNRDLEDKVAEELNRRLAHERALVHQSRQAAMGEMLGNIAHQWRQPLNALALALANIQDAHQYGELTEAYLKNCLAQGNALIQKMSSTITDFMDFFRPDKEPSHFSLRAQVLTAVNLVRATLQRHGITVELREGADVHAMGHPNEFSQVLLNLLGNASDAIQGSGRAEGVIQVEVSRADGRALIRLADNGGGIRISPIERIFEPYLTDKDHGTGLGLYMSRMILEQSMNGTIEARNIPGGAEFSITIPLAEAEHGVE